MNIVFCMFHVFMYDKNKASHTDPLKCYAQTAEPQHVVPTFSWLNFAHAKRYWKTSGFSVVFGDGVFSD